jgi:hypothetical protein
MNSGESNLQEPAIRPLVLMALAVSAVITLLAVYFFFALPNMIAQGGIPEAQTAFLTLSPIFFPQLTFALLAALGLMYFIANVRRFSSAVGGMIFKETGTLQRVLTLYSIAVVYPFLLPWFGFVVPTILLMVSMTLFLGTRVWWQVIGFTFLTPVTIRFVFERLLAISLPRASIEIIEVAEEALMQLLVSIFL